MIEVVFGDIDGCMGRFVKPVHPNRQNLRGNLRKLRLINRKAGELEGVLLGVITGRSFYQSREIMEESGHLGPSAFEMGNVIWTSEKGDYPLFEKHPKFSPEDVERIKYFINWRDFMESEEIRIQDKFLGDDVRQMKDRTCMLTYEFARDIGTQLYEHLRKIMPKGVSEAIDAGILKVLHCDIAIDILPNIGKGDAVKYLLAMQEVCVENCLGIGDSSHSDLDLLRATGYATCPSNADEETKEFVASKGKRGFIAEKSFHKGVLEIFDYISRINSNGKLG